jgi:tetratricopeptide (TPR) repeat protein
VRFLCCSLCFGFVLGLGPLAFGLDLAAKGFDHFYNLEFDQSVAAFDALVKQRPEDPKVYNHLAQAVLYREMHRGGALESELVSGNNPFLKRDKLKPSIEDQKRFEAANAKALELCAARLTANPNDVDALYAQGVAYGLRANYLFLVKKAWMDALRDATSARKAHAKVLENRPEMVDAHLIQGLHDYVVGSLPWTYKLLGFLVGFRGDKEGGIASLQMVAEKGNLNKNDAKVLLGVVYRRERKPELAIPLLRELMAQFPRNYLYRLEMVQMYADMGDKQKALDTLAELDKLKQLNTPGLATLLPEKINFSRGNLLFWYRDYDTAISELRKATGKAKELDLNTGSMAWLRLGQCYDVQRKRAEAESAYRSAIQLAPDSDAARQSRQYLSSPYKRAAG